VRGYYHFRRIPLSGTILCQAIAALGVSVLAATISQEYTTSNQQENPGGGWQATIPSTAAILKEAPPRRG
jgi:hypothetical protein